MSELTPRVLHVEDNHATVKIVAVALSRSGIGSHHAGSGSEALEALAKGSFDVVISDVMMPGMDGLEMLRRIRGLEDWRLKNTHVLMLTAKDGKEGKMAIFEAGADDFLAKPFDVDELVMRVRVGLRLRALAMELKTAQDENERILGVVAHDLRNPIGVIQGIGELFTEGYVTTIDNEAKDFFVSIRKQTESMLALISDLLDVTRIEAGKLKLNREMLDLPSTLAYSWSGFLPQGRVKGIEMAAEISGTLPQIWADQRRLWNILDNLLSNAIKFSKKGDKVFLRAHVVHNAVEIVVEDTGQGMDPAETAKVFEKMTRLSPRATGGELGTGLGLALTRKLVELHGGKVRVVSKKGEGSTFTITLPLNG